MTQDAAVEVVIPVHDASRPLGRTLRSLRPDAEALGEQLRITVVCHNVAAQVIADSLTAEERDSVHLLELHDGRSTPAGPRAEALARSRARFVSFIDSDDWLEPGALTAWLEVAERVDAVAVIAPERHARGRPVRNPPLRPWHRGALDPRLDRLPYRSAMRGLFSRSAALELGIGFGTTPGNGSDLAFTLGYWFSGRPVHFATRTPAYVLGDDAEDRVTRAPRPLAEEMAATRQLLEGEWCAGLDPRDRRLIATKFVRVHLLPGLATRTRGPVSGESRAAACRDAAEFLTLAATVAPGFERSLSMRDARLGSLLRTEPASSPRLRRALAAWWRFRPFSVLLTPRPGDLLRRDAPIRWVAAMVLLSLRLRPAASAPSR